MPDNWVAKNGDALDVKFKTGATIRLSIVCAKDEAFEFTFHEIESGPDDGLVDTIGMRRIEGTV